MNNIYFNAHEEFFIDVSTVKAVDTEVVRARFSYTAPDSRAEHMDDFEPEALLECLTTARGGTETGFSGRAGSVLAVSPTSLAFDSADRGIGGRMPIETDFDHFLLDAFTVIENGERKRKDRKIHLGSAERCILSIFKNRPDLLRNFTPRGFEVAVAFALKEMAFSEVTLTRFSKDRGVDVYAVYAEGDISRTVVVEVKHHDDKVGLEIVDRLYGVRSRDNFHKALLVTSSGVTGGAKQLYRAKMNTMAFVDYEELKALLERDTGHWLRTPSDLWITCDEVEEKQATCEDAPG
jgi:hypothetical protein